MMTTFATFAILVELTGYVLVAYGILATNTETATFGTLLTAIGYILSYVFQQKP
jgi:hypothetical protein